MFERGRTPHRALRPEGAVEPTSASSASVARGLEEGAGGRGPGIENGEASIEGASPPSN
jgi:hypothetical protein